MSTPELTPAQRTWRVRVFTATWLSYFGLYFCRKPFYITKASLEDSLGWDAEALGLVGTAYLVSYALGQFLSGFLGDRLGPRVVLLVGMAVSLGANAAFGMTNSLGLFTAFMALNGLAQATGWSNNVGTMANWFRREERGTVMGFWATNFQAGGVAANALAAFTLGRLGYEWSYFTGSLVLVGVWVYFLFNQRTHPRELGLPSINPEDSTPATPGQPQPSHWTAAVVTNVLLVGGFYFFAKFIRYALWSWTPYLLQRNYNMAADDAGYLSTVFDVAGIAGVIGIGFLSDRLFKGRRAQIAFLFVLGMVLSCVLLYTLGGQSLAIFGVCIGLVGFTLYGPDALMTGAGAIDVGSARHAVLASGIINGLGSLGSVAQELLLGGLLKEGGAGAVFGALLGSSLASAAFLGVLLVRNRTGKADL